VEVRKMRFSLKMERPKPSTSEVTGKLPDSHGIIELEKLAGKFYYPAHEDQRKT
jgi:hypothetical protein